MYKSRKYHSITRRDFLKVAAAAAGGLIMQSCRPVADKPTAIEAPTKTAAPVETGQASGTPLYMDMAQNLEARVNDLVGRMTLDEKISQMVSEAPAIERLGIPQYNWWSEALHGVGRAGVATVFPQAIGLAGTWNTELIYKMAVAISDEARAMHHHFVSIGQRGLYQGLTFFSPNINIFRDPRWGRGQETYGEDPYLTSRLGSNFVRGLQGDDPRYLKLVATAKHFAAHSGPEATRFSFNSIVSQRDLRMTYLPAFQALVTEAKAYSVMSSYNRINGEADSASPTLLQKILREEWGFDGYVVSDWGSIFYLVDGHHVAKKDYEAAAMAVKAGCDLELCGTYGIACDYQQLQKAMGKKLLTEADIDRAVKRLFTARFRLGMFDDPTQVAYTQIPYSVVDSAEHRQLALEVARQCLVLLKNEGGLLPLDKTQVKSIAVIGPNADDTLVLTGNYMGTPAEPVSVLAGIRAMVSPGTKVTYVQGTKILGTVNNGVEDAVKAAKEADVAVLVMGLSQQLEGEEGQREGNPPGIISLGDRSSLDLTSNQEELIEAVYASGKPVVLVLINGSAVAINWADEHIPAILEAWYPGQAGGTAVAEALFGQTNPGGRLPVTFYKSVDDLPPFDDYSMENRTYRYFKGQPLYPFGFGLSYTTFAYSSIELSPITVKSGEPVSVTVEVENTGKIAGDEVVQLYLKDVEASQPVPLLQLQGFQRIRLEPGEKKTVQFTLTPAQMSFADENGNWLLEPGDFTVWVGGRQPEAGKAFENVLEGKFTVVA